MSRWFALAAALGLVAYAVLSFALMALAPEQAWTVLALFGPLLATLAANAWQRRHGPTLLACALLAGVLVWVWQRGGVDVNRLYVLQHGAIHAFFGWVFGLTLRPGNTPLITAMAMRLHSHALSEPERRYTRRLTLAWTLFFAAMVLVSLALYALAPWGWWSFFCTVLTPAAALAGIAGEVLWRRWRHPEFEQVPMRRVWQIWREQGAA
jgi:uncharacterized membrane protein